MKENSNAIWLGQEEKRDSEKSGGEEENLNSHIPEELIEGILSKVCYPSLYKARLLCRSWYTKFLIPRPDELEGKSTTFQKEVSAAAVKWPKYGPISVFGKEIIGYDRSSNCWQKLALHERVPVDILADAFTTWRLAFAGCLMCALGRSEDGSLRLLVANTLTGDWNLLPCPPEDRDHPILDFRFTSLDSQNYKILVHNLPCPEFQAHVFESNPSCRTWTSLNNSASPPTAAGVPGLSPFSAYTDAYINGNFYCMSKDSSRGTIMWKFASETGIWEQVFRSVEFENAEFPGGMFQCGEKFIVVSLVQTNSPSPTEGKASCLAARVYELNLRSLKLTFLSKSPPGLVIGILTTTIMADAECIYFCDVPDQGPASFTSHHVNDRSWSCLPSPLPEYKWKWGRFSTFEPGLNPFASP